MKTEDVESVVKLLTAVSAVLIAGTNLIKELKLFEETKKKPSVSKISIKGGKK